jgi:hypothetical protein
MKAAILFTLLLLAAGAAHGGQRSSASYNVLTETADAGGVHAISANYTNDGSLGGATGISTVAAPAVSTKGGYIGQLYDVTGLMLTAASLNLNEGTSDQLNAFQTLDDATLLAIPAASVAWSVVSGPLTGISANGMATAGTVFQSTPATPQGSYQGDTSTLGLTVVNVNVDDFGAYAGDQIDDAWQVLYFGQPPNANAGPVQDISGTGQTNLFKYVAGLNPLDGSRFILTIAPVVGQPGQKALTFSPRLSDRTYTITSRPALSTGSYVPLANPSAPVDTGSQRTVNDLSAGGSSKFYRVEISKP